MSDRNPIDYIAWWGAVSGTLALFWEMYTWHASKPSIRIDSVGLCKGTTESLLGEQYLATITFTNVGDQKTTVTEISYSHYRSWFDFFRRRPDSRGVHFPPKFIDLEPLSPIRIQISVGSTRNPDPRNHGVFFIGIKDASHTRPKTKLVRKP